MPIDSITTLDKYKTQRDTSKALLGLYLWEYSAYDDILSGYHGPTKNGAFTSACTVYNKYFKSILLSSICSFFLDETTQSDLGIFNNDNDQSVFQKFDFTQTARGKKNLKNFFSSPSDDKTNDRVHPGTAQSIYRFS